MHHGNLKRLKEIRDDISTHIKENPAPETSIYFLLKWISRLTALADEIHFRPEANRPQLLMCKHCNHHKSWHDNGGCWGDPKVKGICSIECRKFKS